MTRTPPSGGTATQLPASRPGSGGSVRNCRQSTRQRWVRVAASRQSAWRRRIGTQLPADRPGGGGSGTAWRPDCPKCSDGGGGWVDHPIAAGIAIGATAGATAAAIGSSYYLPADCPPYYWDGFNYSCYSNWYEPQYEGDTIVYMTVPDPSGGQQPPAKWQAVAVRRHGLAVRPDRPLRTSPIRSSLTA